MKKLILVLCAVMLLGTLCLPAYAESDYEMLKNGGFEQVDTSWQKYYMASIDFCDTAHSGNGALLVSHRQHSTDIARQYITEKLAYYGHGEYEFSAWVRLADPSDQPIEVCVAIGVYCAESQNYWFTTNYVTVTSEWTYISTKRYISWSTDLETAEFYLVTPMDGDEDTTKNFRDLIVDDCSMKPTSFTGEPFAPETTEPPTTEPPTTEPPATEESTTAPEDTEPSTSEQSQETPEDSEPEQITTEQEQTDAAPKISTQTLILAGTMIAVGVIALAAAVALTVSYVRGKKNEASK